MRKQESGKAKIFVVLLVLILLVVLVLLGANFWYKSSIKAVQADSEKVQVEIASGSGISKISEQLKEKGLIKNSDAFMIFCKLNKKTSLQAGKYVLDKNMSVSDIINQLENGDILDETVTITFPEGKNMKAVVETIAEKTNNSEDEIYDLLKDEEYLDSLIDKYWFITDEIKDKDIYYSLEGYLYPDTYIFENKDVDVKDVFAKMLDKMDSVLTPYKSKIQKSDYSVHELLSLASVVELEAKNEEDRAGVAEVFFNRLDKNMALQSDVTTYYALKIDMGEKDLSSSDLAIKNPYNTRASSMAGKIPVGPICMMSESSIKAVVEPDSGDDLFFVADKNGKVYFSKTNEEHDEKVKELKENNLWFSYDE